MFDHIKTFRDENILDSECETIVVTTNTCGVMGKGLAKSAALKYPEIVKPYKIACTQGKHNTENPLLITRDGKPQILCVATKQHWRNKSRIEWIESGIQWMVSNQNQFESIALPPFGCGLGGLEFNKDLKPLLVKYLPLIKCPIELYLPN